MLRKHPLVTGFLTAMCVVALFASAALAGEPTIHTIRFSRTGMKLNGTPLNGTFDFKFKLLDAPTGGNLIGELVTISGVSVSNGSLPAQSLDFGPDAFNGEARFVQVLARQGTNAFKSVGSRSRLFAAPYALSLPGMYTTPSAESPNIIGGFAGNVVSEGVVGATISGGGSISEGVNSVTAIYGTIGGGANNVAGNFCTVGGGPSNTANGDRTTIGGGGGNFADNTASTIGGGLFNTASSFQSTVAGGGDNTASNGSATVGGGNANTASGASATIAGGVANLASSSHSTIAGGFSNTASGSFSTVAGGELNTASGTRAVVPGGSQNVASGAFSFAAGRRAKADANGAFVWGDSTNADIFSGGTNTFNVRASGGTAFYSNAAATSGVLLAPGGGSWSGFSDRNSKTNIQPVDPLVALEKVLQLPISTWNYTAQDESIRHIGPMAQDFHAAFAVGESDRHITTIDADGVALAAIQGLHQLLMEREAQIAELTVRLARVEAALLSNEYDRTLSDPPSQLKLQHTGNGKP